MSAKGPSPKKTRKGTGRSLKAGLVFPVCRVGRYLRKNGVADRLSSTAPVYLTAVLEYMVTEILEIAGAAAKAEKRVRITPHHLQHAIRNDEEMNTLFKGVTIANGGVAQEIHPSLLVASAKKKKKKKKKKKAKKAEKVEKTKKTKKTKKVKKEDTEE